LEAALLRVLSDLWSRSRASLVRFGVALGEPFFAFVGFMGLPFESFGGILI
jgi:hypothetical protein